MYADQETTIVALLAAAPALPKRFPALLLTAQQ
jgi:hypothetical protein